MDDMCQCVAHINDLSIGAMTQAEFQHISHQNKDSFALGGFLYVLVQYKNNDSSRGVMQCAVLSNTVVANDKHKLNVLKHVMS